MHYSLAIDLAPIRSRAESLLGFEGALKSIAEDFCGKKPKGFPNLFIAPVASGAAVLQSDAAVARIVERHKDVKGIDMEIYSVMVAGHIASLPRPNCFALKSVCDYGNHKKADGYQAFASYLSARALYALLRTL